MDGYCEHGGTRFPHTPACRRAWLSSRGMGKPGFPIPPPAGGFGRPGPQAGAGETRFLHPPPAGGCRRAWPARRGMGQPGCPSPRPWAGVGGGWGNRVVPRPRPQEGVGGRSPHAGVWSNWGSPRPRPQEGVGGLRPSKKNLCSFLFVCGGAAWRAEVTIARSVLPSSQPPSAGGRRRVSAPAGGGSGRGPSPRPRSRGAGGTPAGPGRFHRAWCAMRMTVSRDHEGTRFSHPPARGRASLSRRGLGESRFPHTPTRWESVGGRSPRAGVWGNPVAPSAHPLAGLGRARPAHPGPARGRVWEGYTLPGIMFVPWVCGAAEWTADMVH